MAKICRIKLELENTFWSFFMRHFFSYFSLKYSYFSVGTESTQNCGFVAITENLKVSDWMWFLIFLREGISRP